MAGSEYRALHELRNSSFGMKASLGVPRLAAPRFSIASGYVVHKSEPEALRFSYWVRNPRIVRRFGK